MVSIDGVDGGLPGPASGFVSDYAGTGFVPDQWSKTKPGGREREEFEPLPPYPSRYPSSGSSSLRFTSGSRQKPNISKNSD